MKINGSLVFDASGISQIENLRVEKITGAKPTWGTNDIGRLIYVTTEQVLYVGGGADWVAIAAGGNTEAILSEVDSIEITLGDAVNADGSFNAAGITLPAGVAAPTSFTDALNKLALFASGKDELAELDDVTLTSSASGDLLQFNGTAWVNKAAGADSGIQAHDAGLDALAAFNTDGIMVQTAEDTFVGRSLTAPAEGLTITNADGVAGSPTFGLANDLAAVEGLSTTGLAVRTADDTWATRTLTGTSGNIVVTNGDGVAGAPTFDLAEITQTVGGVFKKFTTDAQGRVIAAEDVATADITALVDATYVNTSGDTVNGNLTMSGGATITGLPTAVNASDAVNKAYADAIAAGLSWKDAVRVATTANVDLAAPGVIDGVTLVEGNRVLVKNQTTAAQNGIYVLSGGALVRTTDMDEVGEFSSATVFVQEGTEFADTGWTQTNAIAAVDTDDVVFSQFSGSANYTFGTGLNVSGNTVSVALGAGIGQLPTSEVGLELYSPSASALFLTTDGATRSTDTSATLGLLLDGTGGLAQGANGLAVNAGGVTNAMLSTGGSISLGGDSGTGVLALGGSLSVTGDATQGVSTTAADGSVTVTIGNATATQLGVAKFDADTFTVTDGAVSLTASLSDLTDVGAGPDTATSGDVLSFDGTEWTNVTCASLVNSVSVNELSDVDVTGADTGDTLVYNGTEFVNKKTYFLFDSTVEGSPAASYTVDHNIGQKYCNVTVVDSTDEVVIPQSVKFMSANQLVVTFNTAIDAKIVVMGLSA